MTHPYSDLRATMRPEAQLRVDARVYEALHGAQRIAVSAWLRATWVKARWVVATWRMERARGRMSNGRERWTVSVDAYLLAMARVSRWTELRLRDGVRDGARPLYLTVGPVRVWRLW